MKHMTSFRHPGLGLWSDTKAWLSLLIIPAGLAIGIFLFSRANRKSQRETASQREKIYRDIASDRAQEALLQSYLDRMTDLLLENHLRDSGKDSEVLAVAKAWTVTVLRRLDQTRTTSLLTFLTESKLISTQDTIRLLKGTDLSGADLRSADLRGADLRETDLSMARYDANTRWPEGFTPPSEAVRIENSEGENSITI